MTCARITFEVPLATVNTSNRREHHMQRHRRAKGQRDATNLLWPGWSGPALLVVRLTRVSPRALDSGDNLPISMKSIRDEVARQLRLDDASPLVRWVYAQAHGAPSVLVELSWGDDPLAAAVRAQDALAPPPPPVPPAAVASRAPRERKSKAPKKAPSRPLRGLAALAMPASYPGKKP
ncbi:hypothetical protein [Corallococcus sp. AB038B]|uniref:hypothetical protein n=1 Tax=Corallococcus sp. AB038B TaxID=2316718 RepID=UPI000EE50F36|nr:hypothetical protein [Corallococcus sp. AB038B]RKH93638.1 hypothetical protein D7Y04_40260 [Corallococcus sp. AB038B]